MPLTARQILAATTEQQALDGTARQILAATTEQQALLATLQELGFTTTSWQDGSIQKTLLKAIARSYAGSATTLANVLDALLINPSGQWQDIRGTYWFGKPRLEAVQAIRDVTFASAASAPSHSILLGSIVTTAAGVRFEVTATDAPGALSPGGSVTLEVRAIEAGIAGNVPSTTALSLVTPYAGVTAAFDGDPATEGTARETDARYQTRLDLRWSELTYSVGLRAYELWALEGDASVDRVVAWNNYPNENDVRVTLAAGTVGQIANVEAYIAGRSPPNDEVTVQAANVVVQQVTSSPRIRVGTTTVAEYEAAIQAYLDALPIGGTKIAGGGAGRLLREGITRTCLCGLTGVESVGLTVPAADVVLGRDDIVTATFTTTPEWIP
jgi:uncharacterized phage protein gp47/JayE